jgi:hypothetical protein
MQRILTELHAMLLISLKEDSLIDVSSVIIGIACDMGARNWSLGMEISYTEELYLFLQNVGLCALNNTRLPLFKSSLRNDSWEYNVTPKMPPL